MRLLENGKERNHKRYRSHIDTLGSAGAPIGFGFG